MQQALDAMMTIRPYEVVNYDQLEASITALRQALETEQEPVAWANSFDLQNFDMKVRTCPDLHHTVPLYTAPPKREWVGLTDEESVSLLVKANKPKVTGQRFTTAPEMAAEFGRLVSELLKERNT